MRLIPTTLVLGFMLSGCNFDISSPPEDPENGTESEGDGAASEDDDTNENFNSEAGNTPFVRTEQSYAYNSNTDDACQTEFGGEYRTADWIDVVTFHDTYGDMDDFFVETGITPEDKSAAVTREDDRYYSTTRAYFISRHDHQLPGHYLSHDNIDNHLIDLGSWDGDRKVLCIDRLYGSSSDSDDSYEVDLTYQVLEFDNSLDGWIPFGSPLPQWIDEIHGRQGVFDNNGDANYASGAYSESQIELAPGSVLGSEVYLSFDDMSGCWAGASLGLSRRDDPVVGNMQSPQSGLLWSMSAHGDACWADDEIFQRHAWFNFGVFGADGEWHRSDKYSLSADMFTDGWHTAVIYIRESDSRVEFRVDDQVMWVSPESIHPDLLSGKRLWLGSRSSGSAGKAYHDWVMVWHPSHSQ